VTASTKTVLLIDDSQTVHRMLQWALKPAGVGTVTASDGREGLDVLGRQAVDLVIVDLNMPGMDGVEFVRSVRAMPERKDLPIIMLTTERRDQDMKLAFDAGVDMYLMKPSSPPVIRFKVLSLLGLKDPNGDAVGGPTS
jgi:two-component system chemotaxis response regulator CheY